MNWNGQRESLDHLIRRRLSPTRGESIQTDFNSRRRARIEAALTTRPFFIPLSFEMNASGQVSPYTAISPQLPFDFIIAGLKSDTQTRDIVIRRTEDEKPIVYVGDQLNLFLRVDEIAGMNATNGGGQIGAFYLPQPILLPRGQRIAVEMYKTDTTVDPEEANIVLIGLRVFNADYADLLLSDGERERIDFILRAREVPRTVFLKQAVSFESAVAGGEARNIITPEVEEPLLVRGMRTTLRQSLIELRVEGEPNWVSSPTPIWGVAGEDELIAENYQWFSRAVYLRARSSIVIERITNSIDGTNIDDQTGNSITFICETV